MPRPKKFVKISLRSSFKPKPVIRRPLSGVKETRLNQLSRQLKLIQKAFKTNRIPENKRDFFIKALQKIIIERNQLIGEMHPQNKPHESILKQVEERIDVNLKAKKQIKEASDNKPVLKKVLDRVFRENRLLEYEQQELDLERQRLEKERLKRSRLERDKMIIDKDIIKMQKFFTENNIPKDIIEYISKYIDLFKNEKYLIFNSKVNYLFDIIIYKLKLHKMPLELRKEAMNLLENNKISDAFNLVKSELYKLALDRKFTFQESLENSKNSYILKAPNKLSQKILLDYKINPNSLSYEKLQYFDPKELKKRLQVLTDLKLPILEFPENLYLFVYNINKLTRLSKIAKSKGLGVNDMFKNYYPLLKEIITSNSRLSKLIDFEIRGLEKNIFDLFSLDPENLKKIITNENRFNKLIDFGNKCLDRRFNPNFLFDTFLSLEKIIINENRFNKLLDLGNKCIDEKIYPRSLFDSFLNWTKFITTENHFNKLIDFGNKCLDKGLNPYKIFISFSELNKFNSINIFEKIGNELIDFNLEGLKKQENVFTLFKSFSSLEYLFTSDNIERIGNKILDLGKKCLDNNLNLAPLQLFFSSLENFITSENRFNKLIDFCNNCLDKGMNSTYFYFYFDPLKKHTFLENHFNNLLHVSFEITDKIRNEDVLKEIINLASEKLSKINLDTIKWYDLITINFNSEKIRSWANNLLSNENISRNREKVLTISKLIDLQEYVQKHNLENLVANTGKRNFKELITNIELAKELELNVSNITSLQEYVEEIKLKVIHKASGFGININQQNVDIIKPYLKDIINYVAKHKEYPNTKVLLETINNYISGNWKTFRYSDLEKEFVKLFGDKGKKLVEEWQKDFSFEPEVKTVKKTPNELISEINNILEHNLFVHLKLNPTIHGIITKNIDVINKFRKYNKDADIHIENIIKSIKELNSFKNKTFESSEQLQEFILKNVDLLHESIKTLKINANDILADLNSLNVFESKSTVAEKIIDSDDFFDLFYTGKVDNQTSCQAFDYGNTSLSQGLTGYIELPWCRIVGIKSSPKSYLSRCIMKLGFVNNKLTILLEPFYGDSRYHPQILEVINKKAKAMRLEVVELTKRTDKAIKFPKSGRSYKVYSDALGGLHDLRYF